MPARRAGPRLAASRCRSSTRVRSSATRALKASISCAVVLSWVACWPNNAPCCTRAARSGSDPAESIVGQTVLSGRRGRIQMRVKRMFIWTTKYTELPRVVRDGQNPLPHKWLDHHGGTSRNSGRSNEAGEAARKSEREAEPSAARPQLTRNGRCSGRSPR